MFHIAVIGAGQLGSRHLQGLCGLSMPCVLYAIDPQQSSLDRALLRAREMPANDKVTKIETGTSITQLPQHLDLAIVACSADTRLAVVSQLLEHCDVKNLVLEKVLYQRERDYGAAEQLLRARSVRACVNFPRRLYECYRQIKEFFDGQPIVHFAIQGGGWGLGCNGLHFVDLFQFLGGSSTLAFRSQLCDRRVYPSKRPGFFEFGGTLIGQSEQSSIFLTDLVQVGSRHLITIQSSGKSCVVDEVGGRAWLFDDVRGARELQFTLPFQSQLTAQVVHALIHGERCELPDHATAVATHLPFIRCLRDFHSEITAQASDVCPIT